MTTIQAVILAIVEGITEYLPISSTAQMIFVADLLGINLEDSFAKIFNICIQIGAIFAVVTVYWRKFFSLSRLTFYAKLICALIPIVIIGPLFSSKISSVFETPILVAVVLVIGGIILLFVDKLFDNPTVLREEDVSFKQATAIGLWQCLALMPGTSRAAASIVGSMQQRLSREVAAEFSFFLAVPTIAAATFYSLFLEKWDGGIRGYELLLQYSDKLWLLILGNIVAYIVSLLAIKIFLDLIKRYGFSVWGVVRIVIGMVLLVYYVFLK